MARGAVIQNSTALGHSCTRARAARARWAACVEVAKPRITIMSLFAVAVGYVVAAAGEWDLPGLLHVLCGLAAVATGCHALNQWVERAIDARMRRTASRPLPTQRLQPHEAFAFGIVSALMGLTWLAVACSRSTLALAAATLLIYVCVYTPLKRWTPLSVIVGAVPGALPPVIGCSVAGPLDGVAAALFGIVFLWQVPHVMAIAWIYRDDYRAGGLRMLPVDGRYPRTIGWIAVAYAVALCGVSLLPRWFGAGGHCYALCAIVAGAAYTAAAAGFAREPSQPTARRLLRASLWYLPAVLGTLAVEQVWWVGL